MRVAIVHYWLLGSRGGERVVEALCRLFPQADIFTLFYDPDSVPELIRSKNVHASFLNPLRRFHRSLLPLMPIALESFDLRDYDLVISSESGPAKGVLTPSTTRHICYCHTPMRYLWELYPAYRNDFTAGSLRRALLAICSHYLRTWDVSTSYRVDAFLANSRNVRRRIWKTYRRRSTVCYPPVSVERFHWRTSGDYFLTVSELVAYKRLDYAIRLAAEKGYRLKVVGDGPEYRSLRQLAGPTVEFCGRVPDSDLRNLYGNAAAFLMPGEEDFGIGMVEALASGKPVIALGRGGALEIVTDQCGVLFARATAACLDEAIRRFERVRDQFDPRHLQERAAEFSEDRFRSRFLRIVSRWGTESQKPSEAIGASSF
jgi:glycosyltransferase involved in cell wall biosynthesis